MTAAPLPFPRALSVLMFIAGVTCAVALFASLAPTAHHEPVSAATIPATVCGSFGTPRSAVLVDQVVGSVATTTYRVTCADGASMLWTRP
jgi:hypothetical protein